MFKLLFVLLIINYINAAILQFDIYKKILNDYQEIENGEKHILSTSNTWRNDSIVLFKYMDAEYYGTIGVGTPSKIFTVQFDTTWADIYLPSSHCNTNETACTIHTQYDSSRSSTYKENGTEYTIGGEEAEFTLSGFLSTDTFHLPHIKLEDQTFLEATHMSLDPFLQVKADGIIGLGFHKLSTTKTLPFFYNLRKQNLIDENLFTIYMNRDETTEKAGKIIFGGRDRKHVRNNVTYTLDVVDDEYWMVNIDSIVVGQKDNSKTVYQNFKGYFDTSANTITGSPTVIKKINFMLNAIYNPLLKKSYVNCRTLAKLPRITFAMSGNEFTIESKYYIQHMIFKNKMSCFSPFVSGKSDNDPWAIGGAFLMSYYTEYDLDNKKIYIGETL